MNVVDWIDVGKVAAEKDENLKNYFYDTGVSKVIVDSTQIYLMLGRKGAGKTAVFQHLATKPNIFKPDDIVLSMSLNNYSWNAHALLKKGEKAESISYRDSWRFIILIEVIKGIATEYDKRNQKYPKYIKETTCLLEKLFDDPIPNWLDLLGTKLFKLSKFKLPSGGLSPESTEISIDAGEISFEDIYQNDSLKSTLTNNLEYITDYIESKLKNNPIDFRVFLLFDRLDEAWDPSSIETCKSVNIGLILAADYINSIFNGDIRPVIFLREDIFETLELNDKNKHRQDSGSLLKWDKSQLEKMLLYRINYYAKLNGVNEIANLNSLFDRKEMRNRTTPVSYINRCTFNRPRDVICFYKYIISNMKDEIEALESEAPESKEYEKIKNSTILSADMIYNAESAYSDYLKEEIKDEWSIQRPEIRIYLDAITNIGKTVIVAEDLKQQLELELGPLNQSKLKEILKFLFDISVLGLKVGAIWRYKCNYHGQGFTLDQNYKVHFGLNKALSLTESYS